jgi:acylphosphatase
MTSTLNFTKKKQYTLTLRGKVQDVGFRGYIQDLSKRFSIGGIIYNVGDEEVRILCEGDRKTINQFYKGIKRCTLAQIIESKIEEGFRMPYPIHRAVWTLEQEIYGKLDQGVRLLSDINSNVVGMHKDMRTGFNDMKAGFGGVNKGIADMGKDMRTGFNDMKAGFGGVNKGIADMRKDTSQIPALRKDLNSGFKGTQKLLKEISRKL